MMTRADLHDLVDELPDDEVETAARLLEALRARAILVQENKLPVRHRGPRRSAYGILKEFGPGPSEEDIAEARREMWGGYLRDDDK